jgi:hypothetical protein
VDRGHHRGVNKSGEHQWQKVEAVVDHIELLSLFEEKGDMEGLPHFGVERGILGVAGWGHCSESSRRDRIGCCK